MTGNQITEEADLKCEDAGFRMRDIVVFVLILFALLAVFSYSAADANAIAGGTEVPPGNWIGQIGAVFANVLFELFGVVTYVLMLLTLLRGARAVLPGKGRWFASISGELCVTAGLLLLIGSAPAAFVDLTARIGLGRRELPDLALSAGVIGQVLCAPACENLQLPEGILRHLIGSIGTVIIGWALVTSGAIAIYFSDWHKLLCQLLFASAPSISAAAPAATESNPLHVQNPGVQQELLPPPAPANGLFNSARSAILKLTGGNETPVQEKISPPSPPALPSPHSPSPPYSPAPPPLSPPVQMQGQLPIQPAMPAIQEPPEPQAPVQMPVIQAPAEPPSPEPASIPVSAPVPAPAPTPATPKPASTPAAGPDAVPVRGNTLNTTLVERGQAAPAVVPQQYTLPLITQLDKGGEAVGEDLKVIESSKLILQRTLDSFNIQGCVTGHISGPRITRYEISLTEGVNVKKINQIQETLQMTLKAKSIRVLAPIPGRDVVGIEVPNARSEAVFMRSVMESEAWNNPKTAIPIVLGKDVANKPVVLDLAKAPHLLIAGSTGSGKSVCMNTLIMSLLFKFSPDDLKLIMVDPKIVEFEDYRKLPHLITPVINDAKKVPIALRWAVTEMENRYRILARAGVKKLAEFNKLPHDEGVLYDSDRQPILDPAGTPIVHMPILIVIIDELAELRMQESWKDSETYIARIAQLGRAAGVHIVVATQRPSTNIITGVIKANLPTRIAFRVMQLVDSRVILDVPGAENLLGLGDMLYLAPGGDNVERVQGALVADTDIKKIVEFVSQQRPQHFNESVIAEEEDAEEEVDEEMESIDDDDRQDIAPLVKKYLQPGDDDSIRKALEIVFLDQKISTSYLQRRLKIGYNKAAEIIDLFEERGIVGPASGSGNKREILVLDEGFINQ